MTATRTPRPRKSDAASATSRKPAAARRSKPDEAGVDPAALPAAEPALQTEPAVAAADATQAPMSASAKARQARIWLASSRFEISGADRMKLPEEGMPEIAFAGRSNAGKSSAINRLTQQKRLAFASKTPGRTQLLNFFAVGLQNQKDALIVDLPGYGFAAAPTATKTAWEALVGSYVRSRHPLRGLVLVMDSRRPFTDLDEQLVAWASAPSLRWLALLTKADKLTHSERIKALRDAKAQAAAWAAKYHTQIDILLFSANSGMGLDEAACWVYDALH